MDGGSGHPEQLDLASDLLDQLVTLLLAGSVWCGHWLAPLDIAVASWRA
jgi:hypothetical protein